jgi:anti-sigma B factor antagonist
VHMHASSSARDPALGFEVSTARAPGGETIVTVSGEIDMATGEALGEVVDRAIDETTVEPVLLDLAGCTFMDSTGLAELLRVGRRLKEQGRPLRICRMRGPVRHVFELTGLGKSGIFELSDELPDSAE